jgi:hypothetical protein
MHHESNQNELDENSSIEMEDKVTVTQQNLHSYGRRSPHQVQAEKLMGNGQS